MRRGLWISGRQYHTKGESVSPTVGRKAGTAWAWALEGPWGRLLGVHEQFCYNWGCSVYILSFFPCKSIPQRLFLFSSRVLQSLSCLDFGSSTDELQPLEISCLALPHLGELLSAAVGLATTTSSPCPTFLVPVCIRSRQFIFVVDALP